MNQSDLRQLLSEPNRLRALTQGIRAKIPAHDVEDVVHSTVADALTAAELPSDSAAVDRWLAGIARHKIADYYRRSRRHESLDTDAVQHEPAAEAHPESARDLLRWVHEELPKDAEAPRTLEWMLREASGDHLETIAKEQELSAPAVRQRVSRLRRYLRERWVLELSAALGLLVVVTGFFAYRRWHVAPTISPEVVAQPTVLERAQRLRATALAACQKGHWQSCLEDLERAKALDPVGDAENDVRQARSAAEAQSRAAAPAPAPSAIDTNRATPPVSPLRKAPTKSPTKIQPSPKQSQEKPFSKGIAPSTMELQSPPLSKKNQLEPSQSLRDFDQKSKK